jgi:hypothetical protein
VFSLGAAPGAFPYPSGGADWRDPVGAVVPPEHGGARGVELLIGLRATRPGHWSLRGVTVRYRIGAQQYVTTYGNTYTVCAPITEAACPTLDVTG